MASSSHNFQEIHDLCANLNLEEEEEDVIIHNTGSIDTGVDTRWCLVGTFIQDHQMDFDTIQHQLASLWKPGMGMFCKELGSNRFLFQLYHDVDINRVIDGSPWTCLRKLIIFDRLKAGDDPRSIPLSKLDIWVQIFNLQPGRRSTSSAKMMTNSDAEIEEASVENIGKVNANPNIIGGNQGTHSAINTGDSQHIHSSDLHNKAATQKNNGIKKGGVPISDVKRRRTSIEGSIDLDPLDEDMDHNDLMGHNADSAQTVRHSHRFRFENAWIGEPMCEQIIRDTWTSSPHLDLQAKLNRCGQLLQQWGSEITGNFSSRIKACKANLKNLKRRRDADGHHCRAHPRRREGERWTGKGLEGGRSGLEDREWPSSRLGVVV
ncbi:hypothetical protein F8388_019524 [Cannabis sativa]|uniref:DUF4283 domain-containing protein n=1 Tax=Cannabis sativa TaxID=3483 RepID=A0A7J6DU00_CANSA|nr:hypothetical protein F8388_019524 [Cannabis sativa]